MLRRIFLAAVCACGLVGTFAESANAEAYGRQWGRSYNIGHSLAKNPRTPLANVMTIMSRLQLRDLIALSKNRNVSDNVRRQALRLHTARTGGKSMP